MVDLFIQWDDDLDGSITKKEFRKAIRAFGFNAQDDELDAVFNSFDADGTCLSPLAARTHPP